MIVDCHTHVGSEEQRNTLAGQILADTVDAAFVLAIPQEDRKAANQEVADFVANQEKFLGWAVLDPTSDEVDEASVREVTFGQGLQGIVLYCSRHAYNPTHSHAMKLYEAAQALRLPVFFHNAGMGVGDTGNLAYAQPYLLDEVAQAFPDLRIIVGCMGVPFLEQTMAVLMRHEQVYADLTICPTKVWQTYNIVMNAYEHGVMNKLLFGSGFPDGDAGSCIETLLGFNMRLADTSLPTVPRGSIRSIVERDSLKLLGLEGDGANAPEPAAVEADPESETMDSETSA